MPTTTDLIDKARVLLALDEYMHMLNTEYRPEGYSFTAEPSGKNYRIVMRTGHEYGTSVHAFVDGNTGDLLKAAGWKVPAKGVRYNILTEMDLIRFAYTNGSRSGGASAWAGGYLYTDGVKAMRKAFAAPRTNECVVVPGQDGLTLWDCECSECVHAQRQADDLA